MVKRPCIPVLVRTFKTLSHIIYCFITMYLSLLIFSLPILFMICFRFILSLSFFAFTKGKYKLVECDNACFTVDTFASVCTLHLFAYIQGPCDIEVLRHRINTIFTTFKGKNGSRPYEVMLCSIVNKYGFPCWKNLRESFDIKHQIRYLPGCSDPNRIYTETEIFQAGANLDDDLWPDSSPRWEFLVVPQMKKDNSDEICSAIHFRLHHSYVDGISAVQLLRLCFADQPAPELIFNPVNPPNLPKPLWVKLITIIQLIFLGPWASSKITSANEQNCFWEGPLVGGKYFGRTKLDIPVEKVQKIRKFYNCSTTAIQHFVFTGALRKLAEKKGYSIPEKILASMPFAMLPYPHEYPQNHVMAGIQTTPIGRSGLDGLMATNKVCSKTTHPLNYYELLTFRLFLKITGLFPVPIIAKSFGKFRLAYYISNVPGIKDIIYFKGNPVLNVFGVGPIFNGIRYVAGVSCYENKFVFGFICEQSQLLEDRKDFNYMIEQFECEMNGLMDSVNISK